MSQDESIKIRTLPRQNEKKKDSKVEVKTKSPRWIIYVGTVSSLFLAALILMDQPQKQPVQQSEMSSVTSRQNASVSKHLQDSYMQQQMLKQARQIENAKAKVGNLEPDTFATDSSATFGVQFDQDEAAARVYEDLNINEKSYSDVTPDDKISARLANRKWMNELDRRERVVFVRNFIKSAYNRGYEVEIDANLVVVGVKKITQARKVDINQIMDKLALGR